MGEEKRREERGIIVMQRREDSISFAWLQHFCGRCPYLLSSFVCVGVDTSPFFLWRATPVSLKLLFFFVLPLLLLHALPRKLTACSYFLKYLHYTFMPVLLQQDMDFFFSFERSKYGIYSMIKNVIM